MKNLIFIASLFSFTSPLFANTLECPRSEGIKGCQKEAEAFCDGKKFTIKSSENNYSITCSATEQIKESTQESLSDKNTDESSIDNSNKPKLRIAFGLGFNGTGTAESDIRIVNLSNGSTGTGNIEFDVESGLSLNAEGRFLRKNGWGFTVGGDLDLLREIKTATVTAGGNTTTISGTEPGEWTALVIYGNAVYKWENFYIPFGLNISAINYKEPGLDATSTGIGAQLGIGYETDTNFAFELYSRALGFDFNYIDSGLDVYFEEGIMTDIAFRVKYILP